MRNWLQLPQDAQKNIDINALSFGLITFEEYLDVARRDNTQFYGRFEKRKHNGGVRVLEPPQEWLKQWQRNFLRFLYSRLRLPSFLHGCIPGRSPTTNAEMHLGKPLVITLDVKDFFPSVSSQKVRAALKKCGLADPAADAIVPLVTLRHRLPQGAPTSPILANLAFASADQEFVHFLKRHNGTYSRYVDDITISGGESLKQFRNVFEGIIHRAGFDISPGKYVAMRRNHEQKVTGLVVNDKLRPTSEFIKQLKSLLFDCLELGPEGAADDYGLLVAQLKHKLNGQITHVERFDTELAKKLRGRMNGIRWRQSISLTDQLSGSTH